MRSPAHSHSDISAKINVLQVNAKRVRSQNIALKKILQDTETQNHLNQFVLYLKQAEQKIYTLKQKQSVLDQHHNPKGSYINAQLKKCQIHLQEIMDQTQHWEKYQAQLQKKQSQHMKRQVVRQKTSDEDEIERMEQHVQIFLSKYEKYKTKQTFQDIYEHAEEILETESEGYFNDIEAEIGMLICQFQYLKELQMQETTKKQLKKINNNHIQEELGKLTFVLLTNQLNSFLSQALNRLNYECRLFQFKIKNTQQCIYLNERSTDCRSVMQKYRERMAQIKIKVKGVRVRQQNLLSKLYKVNKKVRYLDEEWKQEIKYSEYVLKNLADLDRNIQKCEKALKDMVRVKRQNTIHLKQ